MYTILVPYGHSVFEQNNIQKTRTQNMQWKQRYRWKQNRSMSRRNVRHFPPVSDRMTPNSVCLWRHRGHGDSNKRWRQRQSKPSQETGVKKMIKRIYHVDEVRIGKTREVNLLVWTEHWRGPDGRFIPRVFPILTSSTWLIIYLAFFLA